MWRMTLFLNPSNKGHFGAKLDIDNLIHTFLLKKQLRVLIEMAQEISSQRDFWTFPGIMHF